MIKINGITKTYGKGTLCENKIFNNFNLNINDSDFICIVGSNGSGKTSLLNCICGSINVDKGNILINDIDVTNVKEYKRYKYIGRVYQNPSAGSCPNLTILENMALADNKGNVFGLKWCVNKNRLDFYKSKLKELGLGLENKMNIPVSSLSGGQRQALALIMATMKPIDFLILDEHTASLDPRTADLIMELTNKIIKRNNITTLMVTHNMNYALEYGNRLLLLNSGKIILDASGEEKNKLTKKEILNKLSFT